MAEIGIAKRYRQRLKALLQERSPWDTRARSIAEYVIPWRSRFLFSDVNRATRANDKIINSTATRALHILESGLMAGLSSPSRPWHVFGLERQDLMESEDVRAWLEECVEAQRSVFQKSNFYNSLGTVYRDTGGFGTSCMLMEEDDVDVIRCYVQPFGSYCLATDAEGRVNTMYRELSYTVEQMVRRWGASCSQDVKSLHAQGHLDKWIEVCHVIEPNDTYEHGTFGPEGKRWASVWIEKKSPDDQTILSKGGYHEFPVMAPRWSVTGEDVYGTGPGMDALGDTKALQTLERKTAMALEKIINPHMRGSAALKGSSPNTLPGHLTVVADAAGAMYEPAFTPDPRILAAREEIERHERRINQAFHADLFLMLTQLDATQMTAREVEERHQEKSQLITVYGRLSDELFDPAIDRSFAIMQRRGMLPEPPPELQGLELSVEYVSILAQAQKLVGTAHNERLFSFVGAVQPLDPEAVEVFDVEAAIRDQADKLGVSTKLLRTPKQLAKLRADRAAMKQLQQAAQLAPAAKDAASAVDALANAPIDPSNVLGAMVGAPA